MKRDTSYVIKRAEHFKSILTAEGFLVGIVAGLVVLLYRVLLEYAGRGMNVVLAYGRKYPLAAGGWFVVLFILACVVGRLVKYESFISGSGIPQVEGEMAGKLNQVWWRVLPAKLLDRSKTEEKFLLTCGASAGLSAAFHAPLAGVMFSLEEIHKNFSVSVLVSVMTASITADYISSRFLGFRSVFQFEITGSIPAKYYGHIIVLGIILGLMGAFYNKLTLFVQSLFGKIRGKRAETTRLLIPFLLAGALGLIMPEILGSGHNIIDIITEGNVMLKTILLLFVMKLLFSVISFGSGAPGGIFFPLLVLGALIGGAYGTFAVQFLGLDAHYLNNLIMLAMAGYFTAIVRAPITGIILIFEMTGSVSQMLSLSLVSIVAFLVATAVKSQPIYESLLENLLRKRGEPVPEKTGEKILQEFVVRHNCELQNKMVQQIEWPKNCLLVAVQRNGAELIPKGRTILMASDTIITMTDEQDAPGVHDRMEALCSEQERLK